MRYIPTLVLLTFLFITGSCKKESEITDEQLPAWLNVKITELTSEFDLCDITDVTIIEYKGNRYYHIYCGLWSCMYCQLFDEHGNKPNWSNSDFNDFLANKKEIKVLPACPK